MRIRVTTLLTSDARNGSPGLLSCTVEEVPLEGDLPEPDGVGTTVAERIREVVEEHDYLSLDDEGDRENLIERLVAALEG